MAATKEQKRKLRKNTSKTAAKTPKKATAARKTDSVANNESKNVAANRKKLRAAEVQSEQKTEKVTEIAEVKGGGLSKQNWLTACLAVVSNWAKLSALVLGILLAAALPPFYHIWALLPAFSGLLFFIFTP